MNAGLGLLLSLMTAGVLRIADLLAVIPILSDTGLLSVEVPLWKQIGLVVGTLKGASGIW
jgi:hypothetical protein